LAYFRAFPSEADQHAKNPEKFMKELANNEKKMMEYLTSIALNGFASIPKKPYNDRVCDVISQNNIDGVVKKTGVVFGLPEIVWKGSVDFIPPAC